MSIEVTMDKIVALCKNRGFIFPGSEIYHLRRLTVDAEAEQQDFKVRALGVSIDPTFLKTG